MTNDAIKVLREAVRSVPNEQYVDAFYAVENLAELTQATRRYLAGEIGKRELRVALARIGE